MAVLMALQVLFFLGWQMTFTYLPLYAVELGATTAQVGVIMSLQHWVGLALALPMGIFLGRRALRPAILQAIAAFAAVLLLIARSGTLWGLALSQVLTGWVHVSFNTASQIYVGRGEAAEQARLFSLYFFTSNVGVLLGPLPAGWLLQTFGYPALHYTSLAVTLLSLLLATRLPELPVTAVPPPPPQAPPLRDMWRTLALPVVALALGYNVIALLAAEVRGPFLAVYLTALGAQPAQVGMLLTVGWTATTLTTLLARPALRRFGPQALHLGLLLAIGAGALLMGALPAFWLVLLGNIVVNAALGLQRPLTMALLTQAVEREDRGTVLGLRMLTAFLVAAASPVLYGLVAEHLSLRTIFFAGAAVAAAGLVALAPLLRTQLKSTVVSSG